MTDDNGMQCDSVRNSDTNSSSEETFDVASQGTASSSPLKQIQDSPLQPILQKYHLKKFGREQTYRDFNPQWFEMYPWLNYDITECAGSCFACRKFMSNDTFRFYNWKKPERLLLKYANSKTHQLAMIKWFSFRASKKQDSSVLKQLSNEHDRKVKQNREYLRVIIECLAFTAQQNIAQREHAEDRTKLNIPWLSDKLHQQLQIHAQWTSPDVQNELLAVVAGLILKEIAAQARICGPKSIILDETSDISRVEQVAICLRFVHNEIIREHFVGFYDTASTDGESLFTLVTRVFCDLDN
jgi:hypothetical protein